MHLSHEYDPIPRIYELTLKSKIMKVFICSYINASGEGKIEAFSNKGTHDSRKAELKGGDLQIFGSSQIDISVDEIGILEAIEYGANRVYKG